jgi:glycosyltransferase involved in cell wall biosynthesis
MRKKTVLIHSNFCRAFTGFGKNKKNILRYLFKTGKYNIVELANGMHWNDPVTQFVPWKCYGSLPDQQKLSQITDPTQQRAASYGAEMIDHAIKEIKPDVYLGIEDIWAFQGFYNKPWWDKINSMVWTTLDSLPILTEAVDSAPKIKHYYVWASFAEKAMKEMGYDHVKTLRGSLETETFYRFNEIKRKVLRVSHGLSNEFIIGFVFRNQLRKSVPNILDGFKLFKQDVPNAKLLLHTHWSEGWDIPRLLEEKEINPNDILTTYFCKACESYEIRPFTGQEQNCRKCGSEKTVNTTNIGHGVSEEQLNEIYNLMDVYCHPFTSGGQEIPIQEAKLTELITLATDYSCGEDYCHEDSGGLPLSWAEYREPGTQFIKASTYPESIYQQLMKVYNMSQDEKESWGKKARQFVIDNCSVEEIGRQLEEIIDSMPEVDFDFEFDGILRNPDYTPQRQFSDPFEFVIDLYENILCEKADKNTSGVKHWIKMLQNGLKPEDLVNHFKNVARQTITQKPVDFADILDKDDEGKRIAVVVPQSETDVLLINGLTKNLKKQYPQHNIYIITQPQYFEYIEDNVNIHKCIAYAPSIDNPMVLEGAGLHKGYFDLAFFPTYNTQRHLNYMHNGKDKTQFTLV